MTKNYLNYLQHHIYFNALDTSDQTNYVDQTYDFTTDLETIKNYLGFDSTMQRNVFSDYTDLTDYYLNIDDSWFLKDQTTFEVLDIYFSDILDTTRFDSSILLFTKEELISDYTKQDASCVLHFVLKINYQPDTTDHFSYSMPLFLTPNMQQIANDLVIQYNVNFIQITFFNEQSMIMSMKEYVESKYMTTLNTKMCMNFIGQNYIEFINWSDMMQEKIMNSLSNSLGKTQATMRVDEVKYYIHDYTTFYKLNTTTDLTTILDMFWDYAIDFYTNRVDWSIDAYAGFVTDPDIYAVTISKDRFQPKGKYLYDRLGVAFTRFLLIRNNIYKQKFTLMLDGTDYQSDYIKFKVKNIIPNQTYDFTFIDDGFDMSVISDHSTDLPLKIDILEYSNNLGWANSVPYNEQISNYRFNSFQLLFMTNKLNVNYGWNSIRVFLSDSLSEEYKDIKKVFVYAPQNVISTKIAKIEFNPIYYEVQNTWDVDKLLPLSEDFTSYEDLSARLSSDSTDSWMQIKIPVKYELIYSKKVPITISFETTDITGQLLPMFEHLIQDSTTFTIMLEPTLTCADNDFEFGERIMILFRYKFDPNKVYTDQIIQSMNGLLHFSFCTEYLDETDDNYFKEYGEVPFVTTRFKLRKKSHEPVQAESRKEDEIITFSQKLTNVNLFDISSYYDIEQPDFGTSNPKFGPLVSINRKTTVKNIPITIKHNGYIAFGVSEMSVLNPAVDGTTLKQQYSPQIGYLKQMNNFVYDGVPSIMNNQFVLQIINDLFNWYMDNVGNDIYITPQINAKESYISINQASPQVDSMLKCDDTYNNETMLQQSHRSEGLVYEGTNAFEGAGALYDSKGYPDNPQIGGGISEYHPYSVKISNSYEFDIRIAQSDVYNLSDIMLITKEAFVKKYYEEYIPSGQKFSKFGDIGTLIDKRYYSYGQYHRQGFYAGNVGYVDTSLALQSFVNSTGLNSNYLEIVKYFMDNYDVTWSVDGSEQILTCNELIDLYIYNEFDSFAMKSGIERQLNQTITNIFGGFLVKVKRVYSADLTMVLESITEEIFSIRIDPTSISPLYANFTISAIKLVYDEGAAEVTQLFSIDELCSQKQSIYDIFGTGTKLVFKYLNYTVSEVPIAVMLIYRDENGYEKTCDINFELKTKLRLYETSTLNELIKYGMNLVKALQFMMCWDKNNQYSTKLKNSMNTLLGAFDSNAATVSSNIGKDWAEGFLGLRKMYNKIWGKYLPPIAHGAQYGGLIYPSMMGLPSFSFNSNVSFVMLPDNYELCDDSKKVAQIMATYLTDTTFNINKENPYAEKREGVPQYIDLNNLISDYYTKYLDKSGYDINLILVPDTTYNLNFKGFLVFNYEFFAKGDGQVRTLQTFLDAFGGEQMGGQKSLTILKEFLNLGKMYPSMKDLIQGCFKDLYIGLNLPSQGRVPAAMHPITINNYIYNLHQADYNPFTIGGSFQIYIFRQTMQCKFQIIVPYDTMSLSMETTSTGIFDINYPTFSKSIQDTQFIEKEEELCGAATNVNRFPLKSTIKVSAPSVIPVKYIDVYVRPLF